MILVDGENSTTLCEIVYRNLFTWKGVWWKKPGNCIRRQAFIGNIKLLRKFVEREILLPPPSLGWRNVSKNYFQLGMFHRNTYRGLKSLHIHTRNKIEECVIIDCK